MSKDAGREVLLPRTLRRCPLSGFFVDEVTGLRIHYVDKAPWGIEDFAPYHFVEEDGKLRLRRGAPPAAVKAAAAEFAQGHADLNTFLDRIGVPSA